MIRVYVAGKISDEDLDRELANVQLLKNLTMKVIDLGCSPYPTAYTGEWGKYGVKREKYYELDNAWLDACDIVVVQELGWKTSIGTVAEVQRAEERGIPVVFGAEGLDEYLKAGGRLGPRG